MFRIIMATFFVLCLALAGCERDEPDIRIDTPENGVEVDVDVDE